MRRFLTMIMALLLFAGCYEVTLTNTIHPDTGVVEIDVTLPTHLVELDDELTEGGCESILPKSYVVEIGGESYAMGSDGSVILPNFFEPGDYPMIIYSVNEGVTYSDGIASVDLDEDGNVISDPALFFFGTQTLSIMADSNQLTELDMNQIVGTMTIDLEIVNGDPDNIVSATANISGLASQWDCINDTIYGDAVNMSPPITQGASLTKSGEDNSHLTSQISMIGTSGNDQSLVITLTLLNGAVEVTTGDIASLLSGFNADKGSSITLTNTIWIPADVELDDDSIKIGDWEVSDTTLQGDTN